MSCAVNSNLFIPVNATLARVWTLTSGGTPIDLTSWHASLQIRASLDSDDTLISLDDTLSGGLVLGGTAGTITATVSESMLVNLDISALPDGSIAVPDPSTTTGYREEKGKVAVWGLSGTDSAGTVYRLIQGKALFSPGVVR